MSFFLIGIVQSVDFPTLIGILGNWTKKESRGFISGMWGTCSNVGNVIGLQLAPLILANHDQRWYSLMFSVVIIYISVAVVTFLFLTPDPRLLGLQRPGDQT